MTGQAEAGVSRRLPDGRTPQQTLDEARERVLELYGSQAELWKEELCPALAEEQIEHGKSGRRSLAGLVASYRRDTGGRALIVDARGVAVADSSGGVGRSFASRPEIATALGGTVASGVRHSNTLGTDLVYVAAPIVFLLPGILPVDALSADFSRIDFHSGTSAPE